MEWEDLPIWQSNLGDGPGKVLPEQHDGGTASTSHEIETCQNAQLTVTSDEDPLLRRFHFLEPYALNLNHITRPETDGFGPRQCRQKRLSRPPSVPQPARQVPQVRARRCNGRPGHRASPSTALAHRLRTRGAPPRRSPTASSAKVDLPQQPLHRPNRGRAHRQISASPSQQDRPPPQAVPASSPQNESRVSVPRQRRTIRSMKRHETHIQRIKPPPHLLVLPIRRKEKLLQIIAPDRNEIRHLERTAGAQKPARASPASPRSPPCRPDAPEPAPHPSPPAASPAPPGTRQTAQ